MDSRTLDGRETKELRIEDYKGDEEGEERKNRGGEYGRGRGRLSNQLKLQELTHTNINIRKIINLSTFINLDGKQKKIK